MTKLPIRFWFPRETDIRCKHPTDTQLFAWRHCWMAQQLDATHTELQTLNEPPQNAVNTAGPAGRQYGELAGEESLQCEGDAGSLKVKSWWTETLPSWISYLVIMVPAVTLALPLIIAFCVVVLFYRIAHFVTVFMLKRLRWHSRYEQSMQRLSHANIYKYDTLPAGSMRLLHISPDQTGAMLECSLQTVDISEELNYEALSYCWSGSHYAGEKGIWHNVLPRTARYIIRTVAFNDRGDGSVARESPILIDGKLFHITGTLASALMYFRSESESRVIWADQLCIDQRNEEEKSIQVARMFSIYAKAARVLVWLDVDYDDDHSTQLRLLAGSNRQVDISRNSDDPILLQLLPMLQAILACAWWSRLWVVQEAAAARNITISMPSGVLEWSTFCSLINRKEIRAAIHLSPHVSRMMNQVENFEDRTSDPVLGLPALVYQLRDSVASLQRDRIFSLQNMIQSLEHDLQLQVDYKERDDIILSMFMLRSVNLYGSLSLLAATESRDPGVRSQHGLVGHSWSPLFEPGGDSKRQPLWLGGLRTNEEPDLGILNDSRTARPPSCRMLRLPLPPLQPNAVDLGGQTLFGVEGITLDTIDLIFGQSFSGGVHLKSDISDKLRILHAWKDFAAEDSYFKRRLDQSQFLSLITAGQSCINEFDWEKEFSDISSVFHKQVMRVCAGRKLVTTKNRHLALAHSASSHGDLVTLLFGSQVPYILRETIHGGYGALHDASISIFNTEASKRCYSDRCILAKHKWCCLRRTFIIVGQAFIPELCKNSTLDTDVRAMDVEVDDMVEEFIIE